MRSETQGAVMVAVAAMVANLALNGSHTSYTRVGLRIPLFLSAAFIGVVGLVAVLKANQRETDPHGHGSAGLRVGLALLVPVVAVYMIAPAPLGAFTASRSEANQLSAGAGRRGPGPLPGEVTASGAIESDLSDLLVRVYYGPEEVQGKTVRLVGFVVAEPEIEDAYRLTRFTISCCAADASSLQVIVRGVPDVPPENQWLAVEAIWHGEVVNPGLVPVMQFVSQERVAQPAEPYEY